MTAIAVAGTEAAGQEGGTFLVTTELDNATGLLLPAMTGKAKIQGDERRLINLATRRLTHYLRVEFWSWW